MRRKTTIYVRWCTRIDGDMCFVDEVANGIGIATYGPMPIREERAFRAERQRLIENSIMRCAAAELREEYDRKRRNSAVAAMFNGDKWP